MGWILICGSWLGVILLWIVLVSLCFYRLFSWFMWLICCFIMVGFYFECSSIMVWYVRCRFSFLWFIIDWVISMCGNVCLWLNVNCSSCWVFVLVLLCISWVKLL